MTYMLKSLHIKNFALIDDLSIEFDQGLSAMTGETGAGKSIILESLQLLFGKRSDQEMIRHGENKASVHGVFDIHPEVSERYELPKEIIVSREIDQNGRHQMKLSGEVTTLSRIKEVMTKIGSIHGQNETMTLFDRSYYLVFVDQVDQPTIDALMNAYLMDRNRYLTKKKHFEALQKQKDESIEKISFLEYQIKELKGYNLLVDEKLELDEKIEKLKHHDKIMNQLKSAYLALDNETFQVDQIYEAGHALEKIGYLDKDFQDMSERLMNAYYDIDDVKSKVYQSIEGLDFDEALFNQMQERSYELSKIETKYQKSINELIDYLHEIEESLSLITDYDNYILQAKKELDHVFDKAYESGLKLSEYRQKLAKKLSVEVVKELKDLDLEKATFDIKFDTIKKEASSLLETGLDQIDFYISLNEGEPVKPLAQVASGGERARFMFALKSLYAKANQLSLLILDEIDIGISGKTAAKVAQKMQSLAQQMQLIVITHLPQVAARADHHYGITKLKESGRMVTRIEKLDDEKRIEMIALMLSDEKLSHFAIEQAKMLLGK